MDRLAQRAAFSFWEQYDEKRTIIRFAPSWAVTPEETDAVIAAVKAL